MDGVVLEVSYMTAGTVVVYRWNCRTPIPKSPAPQAFCGDFIA